MTTLEEAFEQFKQLPDWERFPMPEVFYEHFKVKKPKPAVSLMESLTYTPPPSESLNRNGKVEIRKPAEGGVREIKEFLELPVEVKMLTDENENDTELDSGQSLLNPPTEHNSSETQPELGRQSPNPSYDAHDTEPSVLCHDAECSPASQLLQNE